MKKLLVITPCAPGIAPTQGLSVARRLAKVGTPIMIIPKGDTGFKRFVEVTFKGLSLTARNNVILISVFGERAFVYESLAILYGFLLKKRVVAVLHNGGMPRFVNSRPRWAHFILSKPDVLITPHQFLFESLSELGYHIDGIIPNFIELDNYIYRVRNPLNPKFLYMRGLNPVYNPEMALNVFALVQQEYPQAVLTVAGSDKGYLSTCQELALKLNLHNIDFLGIVPKGDLPELFNKHDIYIQTNREDNMPISLIEAWASGLPVIATNVGGIPYLVKDGVDGILVESENSNAMAKKCIELLDNPVKANSMAMQGRLRAQELTWENVASAWKKALDLES